MPDQNVMISVPKASPKSFNPARPLTKETLLRNQVLHFRQLEKELLAQLKTGIQFKNVKTEADAAAYIRRITAVLHPHLAKRRKK